MKGRRAPARHGRFAPGGPLWWLGVALYVAALFGVQPFLGFWIDAFKERWGDAALATTILIVATVGGLAVLGLLARAWPAATISERAMLVAGLALYGIGVGALEIPQERLHYIEYGLLAGLVYAGLLGRGWTTARSAAAAFVVTAALGWLDEGLQGWLWERRYFDWRDVVLNLQAAVLGTWIAVPLVSARERAAGGAGWGPASG